MLIPNAIRRGKTKTTTNVDETKSKEQQQQQQKYSRNVHKHPPTDSFSWAQVAATKKNRSVKKDHQLLLCRLQNWKYFSYSHFSYWRQQHIVFLFFAFTIHKFTIWNSKSCSERAKTLIIILIAWFSFHGRSFHE